jgi:hypothetical protein
VLVAVPPRTLTRLSAQKEDVHLQIEKRDIRPKCFRFCLLVNAEVHVHSALAAVTVPANGAKVG